MLTARAPAKINLTLHVLGRRADGYHNLESLVAFAGVGDTLTFAPGEELGLAISGPGAAGLRGEADNLVLRAARELAQRANLQLGRFHLVKRLPLASGIGGGSSDAAAALRLLAQHNGLAIWDARVLDAARATGADVPVCLDARARMMCGVGERLGKPLTPAPLFAVLVNPGFGVETRAVFSRLGLQPGESMDAPTDPPIPRSADRGTLLSILRTARNDLEDAACSIAPVIGDVLAILRAAKASRLARMSGSGATCFALFEDCRPAARAARAIRHEHPDWWIKPTVLR
ncbi:MAG: 4-diphosphocytidyl-2-C-methyl-D-erythritol kinase [Methylobacteriaceae bacterium]|jgi:4-diphosphocytidyl-2-C-methyl-D-erythritol kinase|nr:4-diphosphocytidyl-2-C-methyl-D-erythritol kinase [Methylobacteriaceae bacterium]